MKTEYKVKVVKDNYTNEQYIGMIGYVTSIYDTAHMNVCVSFEEKDNKEYLTLISMMRGKILHFDVDELSVMD